jgi:hypothetical protein
MSIDLIAGWQKFAYLLGKYITVWILLTFMFSAAALWWLAAVLEKHGSPRLKEIKLARKTAAAYVAATILFWLFSLFFG